ncbi:MAG: pyridoxal-phosphate dependent enzyme, partial [Anaerolineales bacterium]|nr:pyridoxal-phosphate dependent enzyme [Anaerolineales bacterium]
MDHVLGLQCVLCGQRYRPGEVSYVCPRHGDEGILDVIYDYSLVNRRLEQTGIEPAGSGNGMWRYKSLLPIQPDSPVPPITVGDTPLLAAPRIAAGMNLREVWVKDEGRQPSASLKDRASALAVVKAREGNAGIIAAASTGNAAAALALHCASVQQPNVIFVPAAAPQAKIAQLLVYGSRVLLVDGSYDDAFDLCLESCREFGWYNRNTAYNPYMAEGKKTVSYEICEQLGKARKTQRWEQPDVIFVPVGDGCIISGVHKGFKDLLALGLIDRLPRIMGVQSAGSDYMWQVWSQGEDVISKPP